MTDLAQSTHRSVKAEAILSTQIADAVQLYTGGLAGIRGPDHATSQGYGDKYDDEQGMVFAGGFWHDQELGDTSASPIPRNQTDADGGVAILAVTGVTGRGDILKPVYATDDNVFTLTAPTLSEPVGFIRDYLSGTTCKVELIPLAAHVAARTATELLFLGSLDFSTVADGNNITGFPMPFHGEIVSLFGVVREANVGSGGTILLNLEIDATNVTGGVLTWSTAEADTRGEVLTATAITDANVFHENSVLDLEGASAGGTRTSGKLDVFIKVRRRPGN